MTPGEQTQIPCPKGCLSQSGVIFCGLCGATGWCSVDRAIEHALRKEPIDVKIETKRYAFTWPHTGGNS